MAWLRINETKYLCHCIKQLKKLASDLQTEKNVHSTLLFPPGNAAGAVGEERLGHLSGISGQQAAFPEQSFAASCLLPGSVDKRPLYVGLAVAVSVLQGSAPQGTQDMLEHEPGAFVVVMPGQFVLDVCPVGCMWLCSGVPQMGILLPAVTVSVSFSGVLGGSRAEPHD